MEQSADFWSPNYRTAAKGTMTKSYLKWQPNFPDCHHAHDAWVYDNVRLHSPPLSHFRPPFFTRTSFYVDDGTQSWAWCGQQNWQIIGFYCQLFNKEYYTTLQKTTSFNLESKLNLMQKPKDLESNEILLPNWSHLFLRLLSTSI